MRRRINIILLLVIAVVAGCDTASNVDPVFKTTYIKYYGHEGDQYAADLLVNEDGSMLLLGNSVSLSGQNTPMLIKTNSEGNTMWEVTPGEAGEVAVDVEAIGTSGEYVVALNKVNGDTTRIKLVRVGSNGAVVAGKVLDLHAAGGFRQVVKSVTVLTDGRFVVTGSADRRLIEETVPVDDLNDQSDILAFVLDNSFNVEDMIVRKGGELNGSGIKVFELDGVNAGKMVLFSSTDRPFQSDAFGFNYSFDILSETTPVGKLVGSETDQEFLGAVVKSPLLNGGGYLMAGTVRSDMTAPGDIYLVKYDDEFQQRAIDKRLDLGRNLEVIAADNASSGYYLLANEQTGGSLRDVTLISVSRFGEMTWTKTFGTPDSDDQAAAVAGIGGDRIAVAATIELEIGRKIALIVVKSDGSF